MAGFLRVLLSRRLVSNANAAAPQRATYISSKPAEHHVGAAESVAVMTVIIAAVLGPSCWILSRARRYQKGL